VRGLYGALSILAIAVLLAIDAQHHRYLRARRDVATDRQELFHSRSVFHAATMLALTPGQELLSGVRAFVEADERAGARVVVGVQCRCRRRIENDTRGSSKDSWPTASTARIAFRRLGPVGLPAKSLGVTNLN
jgi:hypothetical protein